MITKDKFVSILRSAGITEEQMNRLHAAFEKAAPQEHEEFLQFLQIPPAEIAEIRERSRRD